MKSIRNFFRKLKYRSKFLGKKKEDDYYYITRGNVDNQLTELMNTYGSDKGGRNNHHNFSNYYSELFFHKKNLIKNFLEVGLGTNDTNVLSNMGPEGKPLASLRAWRDYFQNANIYGADIDKNILKDEDRIKTFFVDQTDPVTIKNLFEEIKVNKFDIILEDGLHEFSANICFYENSIDYLADDGIYIMEDIYVKDQNKFIKYFNDKKINYSIVDIYHENNISNNCLIIIKKNG